MGISVWSYCLKCALSQIQLRFEFVWILHHVKSVSCSYCFSWCYSEPFYVLPSHLGLQAVLTLNLLVALNLGMQLSLCPDNKYGLINTICPDDVSLSRPVLFFCLDVLVSSFSRLLTWKCPCKWSHSSEHQQWGPISSNSWPYVIVKL